MKALLLALALLIAHPLTAGAHDLFPNAPAPKEMAVVIAQGTFAPVDARHEIQGGFKIEKRDSGIFLVTSQDFKVSQGPDLRFILRNSATPRAMLIGASLKMPSGAQEIQLPLNEELLKSFNEVVVYCVKYHVDFGVGKTAAN